MWFHLYFDMKRTGWKRNIQNTLKKWKEMLVCGLRWLNKQTLAKWNLVKFLNVAFPFCNLLKSRKKKKREEYFTFKCKTWIVLTESRLCLTSFLFNVHLVSPVHSIQHLCPWPGLLPLFLPWVCFLQCPLTYQMWCQTWGCCHSHLKWWLKPVERCRPKY